MNLHSKLIEDAVEAFATLPGIGKKTALRLVLHLLKQPKKDVSKFGEAIVRMRNEIKFCSTCHNISDGDTCSICNNRARKRNLVCVVEDIKDIMAIENTQQFSGLYHVLGGIISPMEGIGPDELNIDSLVERVSKGEIDEIIMAISPTIEGDTTIFYLTKKLKEYNVKVTTIARGISFGGELEYTDELTLARSITNRLPYDNYLSNNQ